MENECCVFNQSTEQLEHCDTLGLSVALSKNWIMDCDFLLFVV